MPFSPSDISGLKIWLKADAGAGSSDNDPVGTWTDQSGTSHDFTQATSGKKPLYRTNIRNGLPVVRFDGSDDEMSGGDLSAVFTSGASMVCAVSPTGALNKSMVYKTKSTDNHWRFTDATGYWGIFRSSRVNAGTSLPNSGWHIWSCTATNGTAYKLWIDSVSKFSLGSFTFDGGNNHNLARQETDGYYTAMDLGELIVYDSALSDTNRGKVEAYLGARWALSIPNVYGEVLTVTPSLPAGSLAATTTLTGVALTVTPTLPAGTFAVDGQLFGVALTVTPSLPAGTLRFTKIYGVALTTTPTLPAGRVATPVRGVVLSITSSLPAGAIRFTAIYGVAKSTTPTLPAGSLVYPAVVTGVVLTIVPRLPAGMLHYGGSPGGVADFWTIDIKDVL